MENKSPIFILGMLPRSGTKTPSVRHLDSFFKLFPRSSLIILVRDGRAVVESCVRSFNCRYDTIMRHWAEAARTIIRFSRDKNNSGYPYLVVRYEDLVNGLEEELRKIFAFLGLDPAAYDFEATAQIPVRGSSDLKKKKNGELHWKPVKITSDFNPLLRWSHWSRAKHERFNWIAGEELIQLGFEIKAYSNRRFYWNNTNRFMDLKWKLRDLIRRQIFERFPAKLRHRLLTRVIKKEAQAHTLQD